MIHLDPLLLLFSEICTTFYGIFLFLLLCLFDLFGDISLQIPQYSK